MINVRLSDCLIVVDYTATILINGPKVAKFLEKSMSL